MLKTNQKVVLVKIIFIFNTFPFRSVEIRANLFLFQAQSFDNGTCKDSLSDKLYIKVAAALLEVVAILQGTHIPQNTGAFLENGDFACRNRKRGC